MHGDAPLAAAASLALCHFIQGLRAYSLRWHRLKPKQALSATWGAPACDSAAALPVSLRHS